MKSLVYFGANRVHSGLMKMNSAHWIAAVCCIVLVSCAAFHSKPAPQAPEKSKPTPVGPELIGRVASIPADRRFVLVQSYGKLKLEVGQILTTRGPDQRTANLLVTGEALGEFSAADVQAGLIEVGDAVYLIHASPQTRPNPAPERVQTP
ncbi:MAG: hypothetical protein ORN51_06640 [Akkermansiaceae bacterium]|jgi:hypothetical protein|nr:hypothetical protein [Akkermansiaceae bacterium]